MRSALKDCAWLDPCEVVRELDDLLRLMSIGYGWGAGARIIENGEGHQPGLSHL